MGIRYVFGNIYRSQLSAQMRVNYFFTPDLSLEGYLEPFAASGKYRSFGELPVPASRDLREYGVDGRPIEETADGHYEVVDGTESFEFDAEDFGVHSFRSNVVLRWEFRPGSTFYLVWQQDRVGSEEPGRRVRLKSLQKAAHSRRRESLRDQVELLDSHFLTLTRKGAQRAPFCPHRI